MFNGTKNKRSDQDQQNQAIMYMHMYAYMHLLYMYAWVQLYYPLGAKKGIYIYHQIQCLWLKVQNLNLWT